MKANITNGFKNYSGDTGDLSDVNVVAVNSAGTAVAGQNTANAEAPKCNAFKNLFHIGNCPSVTTQGSADATIFDATNPDAYAPSKADSLLGGILKDLGFYNAPNVGVNVANDALATSSIQDSAWQPVKNDYTWWIVGAASVAIVITVILWIRHARKNV